MTRLPAPTGDVAAPLKALLVDSWYDQYLGVVILVRIKDGRLKRGQKIRMMSSGTAYFTWSRWAYSRRKWCRWTIWGPGEMGYITAAIKTVADCNVGDTITDDRRTGHRSAAGFQAIGAR